MGGHQARDYGGQAIAPGHRGQAGRRASTGRIAPRPCRVRTCSSHVFARLVLSPLASQISSPADPALLLFKLNKLQQAQNASAGASQTGTPSPQPPSISPQPFMARLQNRHGQSMSMAQPGYFGLPPIPGYESGPFNPFGPSAVFPPDQAFKPFSPIPTEGTTLHAPQGIVPSQAALLLPQSGRTSVASSRPDFSRGFGLDIPEEEEEEVEAPQFASDVFGQPRIAEPVETDQDADGELEEDDDERDDATVPARSRIHSRHQSKLSVALSLRSVGGVRSEGDAADLQKDSSGDVSGDRSFRSERILEIAGMDDVVAEWTGSEDLRSAADVSADEVRCRPSICLQMLISTSRARANGPTRQTRSGHASAGCIAV